jgi:hypothetical protein
VFRETARQKPANKQQAGVETSKPSSRHGFQEPRFEWFERAPVQAAAAALLEAP